MSSYLIIDGYNLISKWPALIKAKAKSIELARSELFYLIQAYCDHHGLDGIIVYDGSGKRRAVDKTHPAVIYSGKTESADAVIESLVYKLTNKKKAAVVTDDRALANMVVGMGASVLSTGVFEIAAREAKASVKDYIEDNRQQLPRGMDL